MDDTSVWERFQLGTTAERLALVADAPSRALLGPWLGQDALGDYLRLAGLLPAGGALLGEEHPPNVVVVPGVMGSVLVSKGLGGVWWLDARTVKRLDRLRLRPDGTGDATVGARVEAAAVDSSYDAFCAAALARPDLGHRTFPYDWRLPIPAVAPGLAELVRALFEDNGHRPVHLVAHSMGGLVVREALRGDPELWSRVGRIAFVGTPHYGSPAIAGYLKNHLWGFDLLALLGRYLSRETLRSLWGVLDLLPAPAGVYPGSTAGDPVNHPCANFDLYDAAAYQLGLDGPDLTTLQDVLDGTREFHERLADWHRGLDQARRNRMLVIAGVGYKTLFRIAYRPRFGFLWEHMDRVTRRTPDDVNRDGDGRVPLAAALLEYVGDTRYVRREHGNLPGIPAVQAAVFDWLQGRPAKLPGTPAAAIAATMGGDSPGPGGDDPGYLRFASPDEDGLRTIEQELDAGALPEFMHVKLL